MNGSALGLNFAIGSVAGVLAGAFLGSMVKGHFRWEPAKTPENCAARSWRGHHGVGAILAFGCSVGQASPPLAFLLFWPCDVAAIFLGARIGLKQLIEGFVHA